MKTKALYPLPTYADAHAQMVKGLAPAERAKYNTDSKVYEVKSCPKCPTCGNSPTPDGRRYWVQVLNRWAYCPHPCHQVLAK